MRTSVVDGDIVIAYDMIQHGEVFLGIGGINMYLILFTEAWLRGIRRVEVQVRLDFDTLSTPIKRTRSFEQGDNAALAIFNIALDRGGTLSEFVAGKWLRDTYAKRCFSSNRSLCRQRVVYSKSPT